MDKIVDLRKVSGLDLKLDTQKPTLIFGDGLTVPEPAIRNIGEMQEVLAQKGINEPRELYFMYRDLHRTSDDNLLKKYNLRYDVTVIKPDHLGREFMKTAGHYHPGDFGELYEVVEGRAICLLQKHKAEDDSIIEDVVAVEAKAGQKIAIPPYYGHILVNPGPGHLVTSNWVSNRFSSEYQLYKKSGGAAYYLYDANGKIEYAKNAYFRELVPVKHAVPTAVLERFALKENEPIYFIINNAPERLDFLNRPSDFDYKDIFTYI